MEAILAWTALTASVVLVAGLLLATRFRPRRPPSAAMVWPGVCAYLVGFTGRALSMTDAVTHSRVETDAADRRRGVVLRSFRYSLLLAAPGLGVAALAGTPVLGGLLPSASGGSNSYLATDVLLLIPWLMATLALWAILPVLLANHRGFGGRRPTSTVAGLIGLHIIAVLIGRLIAGFDGMIVAMALAAAVFVALGQRAVVPGTAGELARRQR